MLLLTPSLAHVVVHQRARTQLACSSDTAPSRLPPCTRSTPSNDRRVRMNFKMENKTTTNVRRQNPSSPLAQRGRCGDTTKHGKGSKLTLFTTVNTLYYVSFYASARF